jgi:hypothetical protein
MSSDWGERLSAVEKRIATEAAERAAREREAEREARAREIEHDRASQRLTADAVAIARKKFQALGIKQLLYKVQKHWERGHIGPPHQEGGAWPDGKDRVHGSIRIKQDLTATYRGVHRSGGTEVLHLNGGGPSGNYFPITSVTRRPITYHSCSLRSRFTILLTYEVSEQTFMIKDNDYIEYIVYYSKDDGVFGKHCSVSQEEVIELDKSSSDSSIRRRIDEIALLFTESRMEEKRLPRQLDEISRHELANFPWYVRLFGQVRQN